MEAFKAEALKIALFVLPGILSLRVKAALSISAPSHPLNAAIDALILTLVDHALFGVGRYILHSLRSFTPVDGLLHFARAINTSPSLPSELGRQFVDAGGFPIIIIALFVGFLWGAMRYHGWDFRLLRWLRVTNRTGENLVWAETLTKASKQSYAVVACKDSSRFMGVIDTFSEEAGNYEILLGNASQVQPDGTLLAVEGEGVLLTRENPIIRVELWNPRSDANVTQGEGG
jgi:hypothetical protein